jgi:hypothetical protein
MGFLDHSTNNIIIDAVLTDEGRYLLANNAGQFDIRYFALADDEVDYTLVQKFGRSVGKEKITKNTPVFEASTLSDYALKHKLKSIGSSTISRLPSYTLTADGGLSGNTLTFTKGIPSGESRRVTVTAAMVNEGETVPTEIRDDLFHVYVPNRFLTIPGGQIIPAFEGDRVDIYSVPRTSAGVLGRSIVEFDLAIRRNQLDATAFSIYSDSQNRNRISTVVSVVGEDSGIRHDFDIQINKN